MIEKMKFLSITGPKADIDRVVNEYLSKYEIHLENAMAQLSQVQNLSPYLQINPYKDLLNKMNDFASLIKEKENVPIREISLEEAIYILKRDTRHFAKRQLTWFKRERDVTWLNLPDYNNDRTKVLEKILSDVKNKFEMEF